MKRIFGVILSFLFASYIFTVSTSAAEYYPAPEESGLLNSIAGGISKQIVGCSKSADWYMAVDIPSDMQNINKYIGGGCRKGADGEVLNSPGLLGIQAKAIASLYEQQPSSREYFADLLDNMGIPTVSSAYAQGTGYQAMNPFLPMWKAFRNFAYSLYIIMFVVVGIMIMLRTKVNAQTVISIQSALPNLLITLILITFSYAIVGFMIDLMYFLIYFLVYLVSSTGIIDTPTRAIDRLLSYSAWSVIFEGRNSIISAAGLAIGEVISGLGTGVLEVAGTLLSLVSFPTVIVAIAMAIAMIKLMFNLLKSYVMLIIQTITAPVQIIFNAMPGSKAFSTWLKKTASYLIAFPVAAAMFILAAVFVGDPTNSTLLENFWPGETNPFGINSGHEFYQNGDSKLWLPPFTLTGNVDFTQDDVMVLIGFFIFLMTPTAVKMAQDWLEVKESPYSAEAFSNLGMGAKGGTLPASWGWKSFQEELAAKRSAKALGDVMGRQPNLSDPSKPGKGG